jgi:glucose-fructose oxidoreductase
LLDGTDPSFNPRMSSMPYKDLGRREFLRKTVSGGLLVAAAAKLGHVAWAADIATPRRPLGVALLGLGGYSTNQLAPALQQTKLCRLAGVVTGERAKGEAWAAKYGFPKANIFDYKTMARLADAPDIDIVYVVTPNGLHAEHAIAAAKAGKHVIVEKPMANTVAECDAIIDACKQAHRKLAVGYRLHYHPVYVEMARLARDKDFGEFMKMNGRNAFITRAKTWRQTAKLGGGGPIMDLGVYVIQAACVMAAATPVAVTATKLPITRPDVFDEVEETMEFTLEFPNGAKCAARTSYNEYYRDFRADGDKGWFSMDRAYSYDDLRPTTSRGPITYTPMNQQAAQMDAFADDVLNNRESIVPGEMGRRDLRIIEATYRAMHSGKREAV